MSLIDMDWENLLSWLETFDSDIRKNICVYSKIIPGAGRGLFANRDVSPNTPLFSVPSAAYINPLSLSKIYGTAIDTLSATQLISLHLHIHRPSLKNGVKSSDPNYAPYLAILPRNFASHPLSWLVMNTDPILLHHAPPAVRRNLHKMANQFRQDWKAVSKYLECLLRNHADTVSSSYTSWKRTSSQKAEIERYLWAWLNVNTRSLYMQLYPSKSDPNNVTLCPLVDLANHSSCEYKNTDKTPLPIFYSPSKIHLRKDDQIYLKYGSHSNLTLFTEYGFIEKDRSDGGQIDIQDIMEARFDNLGDLGKWMESLLKNVNFWGDWFLYDFPPPASPSYRILPALRLLQLSEYLSVDIIAVQDPFSYSRDLQAWRDTIYGEKEVISHSNEKAVWHCLSSICDSIKIRASKGLDALTTPDIQETLPEWHDHAMECIRHLWLEELHVAEAVAQSIQSGDFGV